MRTRHPVLPLVALSLVALLVTVAALSGCGAPTNAHSAGCGGAANGGNGVRVAGQSVVANTGGARITSCRLAGAVRGLLAGVSTQSVACPRGANVIGGGYTLSAAVPVEADFPDWRANAWTVTVYVPGITAPGAVTLQVYAVCFFLPRLSQSPLSPTGVAYYAQSAPIPQALSPWHPALGTAISVCDEDATWAGGGYQLIGPTDGPPEAAIVNSEPLSDPLPASRWEADAQNFDTEDAVTLVAYVVCIDTDVYTVQRVNVGFSPTAPTLDLACLSGAPMLAASAGTHNLAPIARWPALGLGLVADHAIASSQWEETYAGAWNTAFSMWMLCVRPT